MTHAEFCAHFKIPVGSFHKPVQGVGVLAVATDRNRGTITINGSSEQYMYLLFAEGECCLSVGDFELRRLARAQEVDRKAILDFVNSVLEYIGTPIRYTYNGDYNVILAYNVKLHTWSFRLAYTYKTPGYNSKADFIRVEAVSWQTRSRYSTSNTLEGKFDPDRPLEEAKMPDVVKLIVENL